MKQIIKETSAFMRTIGKILGGSLKSISITRSNAETGGRKYTSIITKMVVQMNIDVLIVMAGKSKNIIQKTISLTHANMVINA